MIGQSNSPGEIPDDLNKTEYSEVVHDHSSGQGVKKADGENSHEHLSQDEGITSHDN